MKNKKWQPNRLQPLTVLLVEDQPAEAEVVHRLLRGETHGDTRIDLVGSLSAALDHLKASNYDLILLDLTLPDARGVPLFQVISEVVPNVPIVILTALADFSLAMKVFRLGAHDYLIKDELEGRLLARVLSHAVERRKDRLAVEEMVRRNKEFLAMVSHELRNPMTGIVGFIHLLSKTHLDEVQHEYVTAAFNGIDSLLGLLNKMLDFSSAESRPSLDVQPFDLRDCLEVAANLSVPQARAKGLEMVVSLDPRIPDLVLGDSVGLSQVLANLLGNAIKFTDRGYVRLVARVRSMTQSEVVVRFVIEDSGRGIAPEKFGLIFQPFSQAHREDRAGGTGLGLAISSQLICAMGGVLGVESREGDGSAFRFDLHFTSQRRSSLTTQLKSVRVLVVESQPQMEEALVFALTNLGAIVFTTPGCSCDLIITDRPLADASGTPQLVCSQQRDQGQAGYISRPPRLRDLRMPMTALAGRILVVDDDPLCRQLLLALAGQNGLGCDVAGNSAVALEYVAEHHYQVIFLDHQLPDGTGLQLAERMRGSGCTSALISLSGIEQPCHPLFSACLLKPVDPQAMESLMQCPEGVDWQVLERFKKYQKGTNHSLVRELVETYTSIAPQRVEALQQAMREGCQPEVRRLAHLLRGAAASVGAVAVAACADRLEVAPDQPLLVDSLSLEVSRSVQAFRQRPEPALWPH